MNKTVEIQLHELREAIAAEIAAGACSCSEKTEYCDGYNNATLYAARVAQGLYIDNTGCTGCTGCTSGQGAVHTPHMAPSERQGA
jgi:hypothetical protein